MITFSHPRLAAKFILRKKSIFRLGATAELCQAAMEAINEHKDEPFLAVERAVRQAVKERAMYKIKLFGDDGRADE